MLLEKLVSSRTPLLSPGCKANRLTHVFPVFFALIPFQWQRICCCSKKVSNRKWSKGAFQARADLKLRKYHSVVSMSFGYRTLSQISFRLMHIDDQHSVEFAKDLKRLDKFSSRIVLEPSQILYEDVSVSRGLFFIEQGIVKVERDADATLTRKWNGETFSKTATNSWGSLNHLKCADVSRKIAEMKANGNKSWEHRSFRLARYVASRMAFA